MTISWFGKYGKSVVAFAFAVYAVIVPLVSGDHRIDAVEWTIIATAVGNNLLVYIVPLTHAYAGTKTVINAILMAVAVLQTVLPGGVDMNEWALVIGALLSALGVQFAPAFSPRERVAVTAGSDAPHIVPGGVN